MKNNTANLMLKSMGLVILVIISINLISLIFNYFNLKEGFNSLKFEYGNFYLNGENVGLNFKEVKYWSFYILLFIVSFLYLKRKNNIKI